VAALARAHRVCVCLSTAVGVNVTRPGARMFEAISAGLGAKVGGNDEQGADLRLPLVRHEIRSVR
jgi:hypothetical protein